MLKIRRRTKHLIIAGLIGATISGAAGVGVMIYTGVQHQKKEDEIKVSYQEQLDELNTLIQENETSKRKIILLNKDIKAGTKITPDDLIQVEANSSDVPTNSYTSPTDIVNKIIRIDATKNTTLIPTIIYSEEITPNDLRYQEFNVLKLPSDLVSDEYVDVRINFPTGQDYIVLSKKKVQKFHGETGTVWYEMNEKEILSMSSAIVDAFINGAKLYALTYTDPEFQVEAQTTYPVNSKVLNLMQIDPNILEVAKVELNKALRAQLDRDLSQTDEVDKMKYTIGAANYPAVDSSTQSMSTYNAGDQAPHTITKDEILSPVTSNSIATDKQQDIWEQNLNAINP